MAIFSQIYRKLIWSGIVLITIILIGTIGYWLIGGREYSLLDTFYMTFITISTIGFQEILDLSGNPVGRVFTVFIAISGVGVLLYLVTNLTALVVEGELTESFRRKRMEKKAKNSTGHYIVCGGGKVGYHIIRELSNTKRPYIIIDRNRNNIEKILEIFKEAVFIEGDATDNDTLLKAGAKKASGLFVATEDDKQNLVISLTAKQLNPDLRIVAQCNEIKNAERIRKAGADAVVSPSFIGGLRMASEMVRPTAVSFLDIMLRDEEKNFRVEEVSVPESHIGKAISALKLKEYPHILLLAIKTKDGWIYNPSDGYIIKCGNVLILMVTPEGRSELERIFSNRTES